MPNSNYIAGRKLEYTVMHDLEADGWLVSRASGSHGVFDLIALKPDGQVRLIQCKLTKNEKEIPRLKREFVATLPFKQEIFLQQLAIKVRGTKAYTFYTPE
jgi:Holliday junction resolvase